MGLRLGILFVAVLLIVPMALAEVSDNPFLEGSGNSGPEVYQITTAEIQTAREALMKDFRAYSDDNAWALDTRIREFFLDFRQKIIIGILGANFLAAGVVFYLLNRNNRSLSYDSVMLRRRKEEEDRQYLADTLNVIKGRLEQMEDHNAKVYETYLLPMQRLMEDEQRNRQAEQREDKGDSQPYSGGYGEYYGGGSDGGSQGPQSGDGRYEAGFPVEGQYQGNWYPQDESQEQYR